MRQPRQSERGPPAVQLMAVDVVARFVADCLIFVVWTAPVGDDEGADTAPVRAHSRRRKEPGYCVNGKCWITRRLQPPVRFCLCEAGYFGVRCNEKLPAADKLPVPALPGPWPKAPELPLPSTSMLRCGRFPSSRPQLVRLRRQPQPGLVGVPTVTGLRVVATVAGFEAAVAGLRRQLHPARCSHRRAACRRRAARQLPPRPGSV